MAEPETSESASAADTPTATDEGNADDARITFKHFLETVHPSVPKDISDLWFVKRYPSGGKQIDLLCQLCVSTARTVKANVGSGRVKNIQ